MTKSIFSYYFHFVIYALYLLAAIPEKVHLRTQLMTQLFENVWPKVFLLIWFPFCLLTTVKLIQFVSKEQWEEFLDVMHMYFVGCNCLYILVATHRTATSFKTVIDGITKNFKVWERLNVTNMQEIIIVSIFMVVCYTCYISTTIYYGEVLIPVWLPFIDNDQEGYPLPVFIGLWIYELTAGGFLYLVYGVVAPFPVVMTTVIINELDWLEKRVENVKFDIRYDYQQSSPLHHHVVNNYKISNLQISKCDNNALLTIDVNNENVSSINTVCTSESHTKTFIAEIVEHHKAIISVTKEVSTIYHNVLLTQMLFTVCHSCFLAFNIYYTERLTKVVFKSSPILVFSYYLLYMQCWNGDRLTEAYDQLFRALYRCPWYDAPHSFKTSLNIMMMFCKRPVELAGGGIFKASLHSFSQGVQQSISYILLLKQLTPEK